MKVGRPQKSAPDSPVFESMQQCYAITGIPVEVQKAAKAAGCKAFVGSRVHLYPLLQFLHSKTDELDGVDDWGTEYKKWKSKREKIAHDKEARLTASKGEVSAALERIGSALVAGFDRIDQEMPPILKGLEEVAIHERLKKAHNALRDEWAASMERLEKGE